MSDDREHYGIGVDPEVLARMQHLQEIVDANKKAMGISAYKNNE